jgi:hypothetical protein
VRLDRLQALDGKRGKRLWVADGLWYEVIIKKPRRTGSSIYKSDIAFAPDYKWKEMIDVDLEIANNAFKLI